MPHKAHVVRTVSAVFWPRQDSKLTRYQKFAFCSLGTFAFGAEVQLKKTSVHCTVKFLGLIWAGEHTGTKM